MKNKKTLKNGKVTGYTFKKCLNDTKNALFCVKTGLHLGYSRLHLGYTS